jgi:hypothetical protein
MQSGMSHLPQSLPHQYVSDHVFSLGDHISSHWSLLVACAPTDDSSKHKNQEQMMKSYNSVNSITELLSQSQRRYVGSILFGLGSMLTGRETSMDLTPNLSGSI